MNTIGKYKIIKELGSGGFGAVYLAEDPILKLQVAIKIFQIKDKAMIEQVTSSTGDPEQVLKNRFIDEARILRKLSANPNIVDLYEFDQTEDGQPYYVMPFLTHSLVQDIGKDVQDVHVIAELPPEQRPRPLPQARASLILKQLLIALKAVHQVNLVHRDIKPANILFDQKGDVQLCDFGIAKLPDTDHSQTSSGIAMGSRNYMAPEQRESAKHVDATADVYSFGVLAYRLYTGSLPVGRFDDPIKLLPAMGETLNTLIIDCLAQKRESRPRDAACLLQQFEISLKDLSNNTNEEDETGTWIDAGTADLKDELSPLRERISKLLAEQGEVNFEEKTKLTVLAEMVDLSVDGLDLLIEEIYQDTDKDTKTKRKFLQVLDNKLSNVNSFNEHEHSALVTAAASVGWDEDTLITMMKKRKPMDEAGEEAPVTANKSSITILIIALVLFGSLGGWWFYDNTYQQSLTQPDQEAEETIIQTQQSVAETDLNNEVEDTNNLSDNSDKSQAKLILKVQNYLNYLGYRTSENGVIDERTKQNIIAFEKSQKMPVTGLVDNILIEALFDQYKLSDAKAWKYAEKNNTEKSYLKYKSEYPNGNYVELVLKRIATLHEKQNEIANKKIEAQSKEKALHLAKQAELRKQDIENAKFAQERLAEQERETNNRLLQKQKRIKLKPRMEAGTIFSDCKSCPEMIVLRKGEFRMGSLNGEANERPVHRVSINKPFAMGIHEVTWSNYQPCIDSGACQVGPRGDKKWGKGNRPVINISWDDAQNYAQWLSTKSKYKYRLPSEAEWEYAAKTGFNTQYSTGTCISTNQANFDGSYEWGADRFCSNSGLYRKKTLTAGSFKSNAFGLFDMHGNASEWVQDCWNANYKKAPNNGEAWLSGKCKRRLVKGGAWIDEPARLRSSYRSRAVKTSRSNFISFRVVREL